VGLRPIGIFSHFYFTADRGISKGFAEWSDDGAGTIAESNKDSASPRIVPRVIARLQQAAARHERFVLWTHLFEPHSSYMPHKEFPTTLSGVPGLMEKYDYEIAFADLWVKKLFDAVFARRAVITSERRMRLLDEYDTETGGKPSVEGALRVFLDSDLDLYIEGGEGWRNYGALGAQVANTPEWGAEMMDQHFDPVVLRLIGLLRKALPDCAEEDIFWGYHFVSGALMLTLAQTGRLDKLSDGLCKSNDYAAVKERMATFMAAGFLAVCGRQKGKWSM